MESKEIRARFLEFFKARGHAIVPSSSLIPDEPSVLLTTAGMQQFKPYYTGEADPVKDFGSKNTASIQKSFRTSDIDEVGDETHLTFFEMLGNFSFGGYFKEDAIRYAWEFLTSKDFMNISPDRIHVTVHKSTPLGTDDDSYQIWKDIIKIPEDRIKFGGIGDNFWGPTGNNGPCGPSTEIYVDGIEIWNIVFNQYLSKKSREESMRNGWEFESHEISGVDTGMGLERLAMISQGKKNIFETDLFKFLPRNVPSDISERAKRIIGDHARAIIFLVSDGVESSNKGAGYILRKLMRRLMAHSDLPGFGSVEGYGDRYGLGITDARNLFEGIVSSYGYFYSELNSNVALSQYGDEYKKFGGALRIGIRELKKVNSVNAVFAFKLYETYGLPYEIVKEFAYEKATDLTREAFDREFENHQKISRAGSEKKFGGHGLILDTGELKAANEDELRTVTRLHTATHLLHAALRKTLGEEVSQRGSDITPERTRFDFLFPRKVAPEELKRVENLVNYAISKDFPVTVEKFSLEEAKNSGALFFYKGRYPERVKVYTVGNEEEIFSKELCGGPHVARTGEIGTFRILKEEASSAGVRRIRATVG